MTKSIRIGLIGDYNAEVKAQNVLGLTEAEHAETNPRAIVPIIAPRKG